VSRKFDVSQRHLVGVDYRGYEIAVVAHQQRVCDVENVCAGKLGRSEQRLCGEVLHLLGIQVKSTEYRRS
jgi:hypothetical protein